MLGKSVTIFKNKFAMFGLLGVGIILALYAGYTIGEVIAQKSVDSIAADIIAANNEEELRSAYVDKTDIKFVCALGKKLNLVTKNVGINENFEVQDKKSRDRLEKEPPAMAKLVNCDSHEEVTVPARSHGIRLAIQVNYEIPFKLEDGYYAILFYSDNKTSSQLPLAGVLNIKMDIGRAIKFISYEIKDIADDALARPYLKNINFTNGGIFGTVSVMKDGTMAGAPKGTKVIVEESSNPDAPLQSFALTNEQGEFILAEPIVTLHFHGDKEVGRTFPQSHTLRIVLPTGEQYTHTVNIKEEDSGNVKLFYKGYNLVKGYDAVLLYMTDIVIER